MKHVWSHSKTDHLATQIHHMESMRLSYELVMVDSKHFGPLASPNMVVVWNIRKVLATNPWEWFLARLNRVNLTLDFFEAIDHTRLRHKN